MAGSHLKAMKSLKTALISSFIPYTATIRVIQFCTINIGMNFIIYVTDNIGVTVSCLILLVKLYFD